MPQWPLPQPAPAVPSIMGMQPTHCLTPLPALRPEETQETLLQPHSGGLVDAEAVWDTFVDPLP